MQCLVLARHFSIQRFVSANKNSVRYVGSDQKIEMTEGRQGRKNNGPSQSKIIS